MARKAARKLKQDKSYPLVDLTVDLKEAGILFMPSEESLKRLARERMPEVADELRRRAFDEVLLSKAGFIDASIWISKPRYYVAARIAASFTPGEFVLSIASNTKERYETLIIGREAPFAQLLRIIDDFLAGLRAGKNWER